MPSPSLKLIRAGLRADVCRAEMKTASRRGTNLAFFSTLAVVLSATLLATLLLLAGLLLSALLLLAGCFCCPPCCCWPGFSFGF